MDKSGIFYPHILGSIHCGMTIKIQPDYTAEWQTIDKNYLFGEFGTTWNYQFYMQKPQIDLYHSVFTTFSQQCQAWEHCAHCRSAAACRLEALLFAHDVALQSAPGTGGMVKLEK